MKTPTTAEINAVIEKALALEEQNIPEFVLPEGSLDFDDELDPIDLDALMAFVPSSPSNLTAPTLPACTAPTGSVKISVRVPGQILAAIKTRAAQSGKPYQTLLNEILRDTTVAWGVPKGMEATLSTYKKSGG